MTTARKKGPCDRANGPEEWPNLTRRFDNAEHYVRGGF
jgi:hypothetical protein